MNLKSASLSHVRPTGLSSEHETYVRYAAVKYRYNVRLLLQLGHSV